MADLDRSYWRGYIESVGWRPLRREVLVHSDVYVLRDFRVSLHDLSDLHSTSGQRIPGHRGCVFKVSYRGGDAVVWGVTNCTDFDMIPWTHEALRAIGNPRILPLCVHIPFLDTLIKAYLEDK